MNWIDGPATWKQLRHLKDLGYKPDHPLTKTQASDLIRSLGGLPETLAIVPERENDKIPEQGTAYHFRAAVENAKRAVAKAERDQAERLQQDLAVAVAQRQEFWVDTCRDAPKMLAASMDVHELYQKYGCRFNAPTHKQVQDVLDALDAAMPFWDEDHPELFYQTLELNFRELLRRRQ